MITPQEGQNAALQAMIEMRPKKQWIRWCYAPDANGRLGKVPYQINGYKASTTNPKHWAYHEDAVKNLSDERNVDGKPYDGIGFVFNDDYTGIDWDHCVNEDGTIEDWAQRDIDRVATYCEFSPSRTGIHGIARALLPEKTDKNGKVTRPGKNVKLPGKNHPDAGEEIYCEGRFFTMTGDHLPSTPETIEHRQEEITALYQELEQLGKKTTTRSRQSQKAPLYPIDISDLELIERAKTATNGLKFARLWDGDTSEYGNDDSAADQALCNLLAFWTAKDAARMDRLFRQSGLYRQEKWDRDARAGEKYGEGTIERAIAECAETYSPTYLKSQINGKLAELDEIRYERHGETEEATVTDYERAEIILGDQLRNTRDQALHALWIANKDKPTIFVQSAQLVQIARDEGNKAIIIHMSVHEMKNALTKAADFFKMRRIPNTDEAIPVPASPPNEIAETILALNPSQWPFLPLEAIVETPVIRPDGSILDSPGYDEQTRLYYAPHRDLKHCKVPLNPSKLEMQAALAVLKDIFADFPFVGKADEANAYGAMITPVIRPAVKRHVPLALIDAPIQGAGKGLMSDTISIIATGEPASILTAPANDDEWDKRITSILMNGSTIITIDNIPSRLQSAKLDAVLTADYWVSRLLGQSKMIKVPQRATWIATGNNIRLGGDLARRCYRIRLDPKVSKPWMRTGFRHDDLATYVTKHRGEIITAILTLVRGWFVAGQPIDASIPNLGTFTGWAKMVGSILSFAGIEGFLTNLDKLYEEMDENNAQWANFLHAWRATFRSTAISVATLHNELTNPAGGLENPAGGPLADFLPDGLQASLKEKPNSFKIILSKQLEKRLETCFGDENLRLERTRDKHSKQWLWRVVAGDAGDPPSQTRENKISFVNNNSNSERQINVNYKDGCGNHPHHPQDENSQDSKNGMSQGEKPFEEISSVQQEDTFSERPPANSERPPATISVGDFMALGKRHNYPEISDLGLKGGMMGWNSFSLSHRLLMPDVVARLGGAS
ncbi:MAG TPA: hypothetical protein VHV10_14735 [Ktedonobacteraceae bacterium]|jgi:primase-polymerase (primpol)-like protein|nr:hypothetical protein [Ktedonobacteraceae bacterium]